MVHALTFFTTDMNRQHFNENGPIMCNIVQFRDQRPYNEAHDWASSTGGPEEILGKSLTVKG